MILICRFGHVNGTALRDLLDLTEHWSYIIPFDSHYFFDEWTNDLYGRAEIQKIFLACEIPEEIRQRLEAIDEIYRQKTIPLSDIGVTNFLFMKEWDKENYWFAYRIPPERWEDWKEYYKDPIYFYEKEE